MNWSILLGSIEKKSNCLWFHRGKVCSLLLRVRSGSLSAWWVWHICQFQRFGRRYRLFPRIKSWINWNRALWCRNNFARKKSPYQDYCSDIPRGRGLVQLNALWAWPEMTSKVNMKGGATHNNSKHSLIASSLVIKLIQNLLQYSLKSHRPSP